MKNFLCILFIIGLTAFYVTGCERSMTKATMDVVTTPEKPTADDPEMFTVAFVQEAIDLYKTEGYDAIAAYYNDPAHIDGQWYVFITDPEDMFIAHAPRPDFVGTDLKDIVGLDGSPLGTEIAKATGTGLWIEYLWPNPETGKLEQKHAWAIRHDGYLFGSGYYRAWGPDPAALSRAPKDNPEAFTQDIVLAAIAHYEFHGIESIVAHYNDPAHVDGQWYVFITDPEDMFIAHAPRPDFVGTDLKDIVGLDGSPLGTEIAKATGTGLWIEYLWPNPETNADEHKRTWAIRHDGHLFGSGYYAPVSEDTEMIPN